MTVRLPVTWEVSGFVDVEADSIEDAIKIFNRDSDYIKLPRDSEYVDASFRLSTEDPDEIALYQKKPK